MLRGLSPRNKKREQDPSNSDSDTPSDKDLVAEVQQGHHEKFVQSDAGDGTKASDQYLEGVQLTLVLFSLLISLFIVAIDQTIVSTILTVVSEEFKAFDKVGWVITGFMLPMACLSPSYGKISIAFGRKTTLAVGIIVFETGSLVSALATSMNMLIGGRVIAGLGGGAVQAMVTVVISEIVPISKRSLSLSLLGIVFSVASVAGPFIGGAFTTKLTWRWCFYINLPLGGVALALLLIFFRPPSVKKDLKSKLKEIDYLGTALLTAGLVLVLLALTSGGSQFPWNSAAIICFFVIGGFLLIAFIYYNFFQSKVPLIVYEVVAVPQIMAATLCATFSYAFFFSLVNFLSIYFQVVLNATAFQSGIDLLPLIVSVSVSSALNGVVMRYTYFVKISVMVSAILGPIGVGVLLLLGLNTSAGTRVGLLIPAGVSVGLQFQSTLIACQLKAPGNVPGSMIIVTTFLNFLKTVGGIVGVATSQLMLFNRAPLYIKEVVSQFPEHQYFALIPTKTLLQSPQLIWKLPEEPRTLVLQAFMKGLRDVFYLNLAFALVSLVFAIFTTNQRLPENTEITYADAGELLPVNEEKERLPLIAEEPEEEEETIEKTQVLAAVNHAEETDLENVIPAPTVS